jgi:hypothetical protein
MRRLTGLLTAVLLSALVLAVVAGCSSANSGGSGSEGTLPTDQFVFEVSDCDVDPGGGAAARAAGTFTNNTGNRSAFDMTIDFTNDGVRVDAASLLLAPLDDGESTEWEALGYDSLEEMDGIGSVDCALAGLQVMSLTSEG